MFLGSIIYKYLWTLKAASCQSAEHTYINIMLAQICNLQKKAYKFFLIAITQYIFLQKCFLWNYHILIVPDYLQAFLLKKNGITSGRLAASRLSVGDNRFQEHFTVNCTRSKVLPLFLIIREEVLWFTSTHL